MTPPEVIFAETEVPSARTPVNSTVGRFVPWNLPSLIEMKSKGAPLSWVRRETPPEAFARAAEPVKKLSCPDSPKEKGECG